MSGCNEAPKDQTNVAQEQSGAKPSSGLENTIDASHPEVSAPTVSPLNETIADTISTEVYSFIDESGTTLESRIHTPMGYARIPSIAEEFTGFVRELTLKEAGSDVLLYNGLPKSTQNGHVAVFDLTVGDRDLQQCADSLLRIYAEYYWSIGAYDKIAFHLTNGFLMEYTKWRDGNRIVVDGNDVRWNRTKTYNDSYEEFQSYLSMVFAYAGTLSLAEECSEISIEELRPGDMFLQGGSPGHCVLVVDIAQDKNGKRCFLLAQGYMPAQDFHILKNPLHPEDPWYYVHEITYPLKTPSWQFNEGSLVRWSSFPLNEADSPLLFTEQQTSGDATATASNVVPAMSNNVLTGMEESTSKVTLLAVGDNLIHIEVVQSGKQTDGTYNFDSLYANLADEIKDADIAVINQETILGGKDFAYSGYPNFNSPTEIGDAVINSGFDVILHATNHTMDKGLKGVENTMDYWKQHPGITVLGINKSLEESKKIPIIEKNGIKIAMLNYTFSLNGYSLPKDKPYLVNLLDKDKMSEDIKKAEELADFTIVYPHWGTEYVYEATDTQQDLTEFFYEQGVDLVIGTHPHVIEPVEWIETTSEHRMLVYYSLGNFMSYQKEAPRMLGGMANITITKDASGTYISEADITPIVTHYEQGPSAFSLYKLSDYNEALAQVHGVSDIASKGSITYQETFDLAKKVLGSWFQ
jgi:poly-gamma-glutamate synthesis protein (capsule biosynthesis protein)